MEDQLDCKRVKVREHRGIESKRWYW